MSDSPFDAMNSHRARTALSRTTAQLVHWLGPQVTIDLLINQAQQIELLYVPARPEEPK